VWFQKISIPHPRGSLEIPRGREVSKAKIFKGKYQPKLEFQRGGGSNQKTLHGGVRIFSGITQCLIDCVQCNIVYNLMNNLRLIVG